jgi:hypothetical protein
LAFPRETQTLVFAGKKVKKTEKSGILTVLSEDERSLSEGKTSDKLMHGSKKLIKFFELTKTFLN